MKGEDVSALLDGQDHALAFHETGHAVVARALGAEVMATAVTPDGASLQRRRGISFMG
jgi:hypothetical protein